MRQLTQKICGAERTPSKLELGSAHLKSTFFEARKACLRILRRLTLWSRLRWANPELVEFSCSIPSRTAGRGEDCLPRRTQVGPKGMFLQVKWTQSSWR